jgi:hypothetical protein
MKEKFVELKSEICTALTKDISNGERQKLGELFSLIDTLLLNKFSKVIPKDYNYLYKDLMNKLIKNPNNNDARLLLERVKNMDVSEEGFVYMKLLQIKIILEGYKSQYTTKITELISDMNTVEN